MEATAQFFDPIPTKSLDQLTPDERHNALVKRIREALSEPRFRLAFRIGDQLGIPESLVLDVLAAVPSLTLQIDREKAAEERQVREDFQGEVQVLKRQHAPSDVRHDSRVKHRRASTDAKRGHVVEL